MPFDPNNWKLPANVTVLPPTPRERGGGEPRREITINIQFVPAKPAKRRCGGFCLLGWAVMVLLLMTALGHAEGRRGQAWPPLSGQGPNWVGGSYQSRDGSGGTYTFPEDQSQNGGHGCHTYTGGDGVVRTDCW
jgi:hypothetical protein